MQVQAQILGSLAQAITGVHWLCALHVDGFAINLKASDAVEYF